MCVNKCLNTVHWSIYNYKTQNTAGVHNVHMCVWYIHGLYKYTDIYIYIYIYMYIYIYIHRAFSSFHCIV